MASLFCVLRDGGRGTGKMAKLTHDAVGGKEPHLVAPFFGCAIFSLSGIVVDQMDILDISLERRVKVGVCEESG
jgi:hypothetical protein